MWLLVRVCVCVPVGEMGGALKSVNHFPSYILRVDVYVIIINIAAAHNLNRRRRREPVSPAKIKVFYLRARISRIPNKCDSLRI